MLRELKQRVCGNRPHINEELIIHKQFVASSSRIGVGNDPERHWDVLVDMHLIDGFQRVDAREWLNVVIAKGDVLFRWSRLGADDACGAQNHGNKQKCQNRLTVHIASPAAYWGYFYSTALLHGNSHRSSRATSFTQIDVPIINPFAICAQHLAAAATNESHQVLSGTSSRLHIGSGHLSVVLPAEVTFNGRARPFAAQKPHESNGCRRRACSIERD